MKVNSRELQEMIKEAVTNYLSELDYRQRLAAVGQKGGTDQVSIDKLMMGLDGMEKTGKTTISQPELMNVAKQAIQVAAPLGKGNAGALAQQATSKTGGAPVSAPMGAGNPAAPFPQREGKITVTKSQLKEMVAGIVKNRLMEFADNNNPIMAKREIIALMDSTSRNFESEIIKTFKLQNPDTLSPELQRRYLEIVEGMKAELVAAAMKAVQDLISFPKIDEGNGALKK